MKRTHSQHLNLKRHGYMSEQYPEAWEFYPISLSRS